MSHSFKEQREATLKSWDDLIQFSCGKAISVFRRDFDEQSVTASFDPDDPRICGYLKIVLGEYTRIEGSDAIHKSSSSTIAEQKVCPNRRSCSGDLIEQWFELNWKYVALVRNRPNQTSALCLSRFVLSAGRKFCVQLCAAVVPNGQVCSRVEASETCTLPVIRCTSRECRLLFFRRL